MPGLSRCLGNGRPAPPAGRERPSGWMSLNLSPAHSRRASFYPLSAHCSRCTLGERGGSPGLMANGLETVRERLHHPAGDRFPASSSFEIKRERYLSTSPNGHYPCQILVCFFESPSAFLSLPVTTADSGEQLASTWRPRKAGVRCRAAPPVRLQVQASLPYLQRRTLLRLSTLQSA